MGKFRASWRSRDNHIDPLLDRPQMVTPDELKDIIDACCKLYRTTKKLESARLR